VRLLDFFKKRTKKKELHRLTVREAETELHKRNEKTKTRLQTEKEALIEKTSRFCLDLEKRAKNLEKIDLKDTKEDQRLKRLTLQGLREYVEQLQRLIRNLRGINEEKEIHEYIQEADTHLHSFIKNAIKKYHRATILIGEDLFNIQRDIQNYYKEVHETAYKNNSLIQEAFAAKKLIEHRREIERTNDLLRETEKIITRLKKEHQAALQALQEHRTALASAQQGKQYTEQLSLQLRIQTKLQEAVQKISELQKQINLKEVSKRVHGYQKHSALIAHYRENFLQALIEDKPLEVLNTFTKEEQKHVGTRLHELRKEILRLREQEHQIQPESVLAPYHDRIKKQELNAQEILDEITYEEKKKEKYLEEHGEHHLTKRQILQAALPGIELID